MQTIAFTPPTNLSSPSQEFKAIYISDQMVKLDSGAIYRVNVPGMVGDVVTVAILRGRLAFPVARIVREYNNREDDKRNSIGQKVTFWGNMTALSARSIETMHDNMYRQPAVTSGVDTFGVCFTNNTPIEVQNGIRTTFTFQDRGLNALPVITTYSETIYLNGARLIPTTNYTITYTTGTVVFVSFIPIVTDVIIMDCHTPMDQPPEYVNPTDSRIPW